jgi:hypothetical protein
MEKASKVGLKYGKMKDFTRRIGFAADSGDVKGVEWILMDIHLLKSKR